MTTTPIKTHHDALDALIEIEIDNSIDERGDRGNDRFAAALAFKRDALITTFRLLHRAAHDDYDLAETIDDSIDLIGDDAAAGIDDAHPCSLLETLRDLIYADLPDDAI